MCGAREGDLRTRLRFYAIPALVRISGVVAAPWARSFCSESRSLRPLYAGSMRSLLETSATYLARGKL